MLLDERVYLFNPFNLKKISDDELKGQIDELAKRYKRNADTPYELSYNIELASNLLYLYGEFIARLTERHQIKQIDNDKGEALMTYELRREWSKYNTDKAPAISYFEAKALEHYQQDRNTEARLKSDLIRCKQAYTSLESKMNAWKKQLEAMKYEIGIN